MNRTIYQSQSQVRTFDLQSDEKDTLISLAGAAGDILGNTTTVLSGFAATPTGPASLTINIAAGRIYQLAAIDATANGAIPQDLTNVLQQGYAAAQQITFSTTGIGSGQSRYSLVQAQFSQVDAVRSNDPTGGLLLFYNAANPSMPFEGPGNDGLTSNTVREGLCTIQVITGAAATTGSEVPPNPTTGWVPLYLVDLAFAQNTISSVQILTAEPSVGTGVPSNYTQAPFLAGLTNSHHSGGAGQAPQIDLTKEVKNILPLANIPASSAGAGTGVPVLKLNAGNPNTVVAGNANVNGSSDLCYDTTNQILYICTTTGSTSTAVWTSVTQGTSATFNGGTMTGGTGTPNAYVIASTSPSGFSLTIGVSVTAVVNVANTGAATLNVDGLGAKAIVKSSGGSLVALSGGELVASSSATFNYLGTSGWQLVAAGLGTAAFKSASGSGTFVASVTGSFTVGHIATFADTVGTIQDGGAAVFPTGIVIPFAGSSAPSGWLLAFGQSLNTTTNAALFAVIGYTYGGSGTSFNAPDMRGLVAAGVDNMGGTAANRITSSISGIVGTTLGAAGGTQAMQAHTHTASVSDPGHAHTAKQNPWSGGQSGSAQGAYGASNNSPTTGAGGLSVDTNTTGISVSNSTTGTGGSQNVQPTIMLNYIIKT